MVKETRKPYWNDRDKEAVAEFLQAYWLWLNNKPGGIDPRAVLERTALTKAQREAFRDGIDDINFIFAVLAPTMPKKRPRKKDIRDLLS